MPEKGLTATKGVKAIFISNTGKTLRQYNISGWKLYLARGVMAFVVLLVSSAIFVVAYGLMNAGETGRLRAEMTHLQDSLAQRQSLELRIDAMEARLQYLEGYRRKLENIASLVSPTAEDSL
ncbi:MAG: hypothetical protein AVO35_01580 [Candidatus Aegiribacteria sp. MLS_C]|nr:MAG: hypothetical protein AVO35_01580 [Candidatus Aegiribacteria sp. MLS_C]